MCRYTLLLILLDCVRSAASEDCLLPESYYLIGVARNIGKYVDHDNVGRRW